MSEVAESQSYTVKVSGPGIVVERAVDLPTAMSVMQVAFGQGSPQSVNAGQVGPPSHTAASAAPARDEMRQKLSIREFLDEVGGRSIPAKILAIAHYMRDVEGSQEFSRDEVKLRFRSAGEVMPGNFPRDFQVALQSGWVAEDPQNRGRYYVTRRGDEAISSKFESGSASTARTRRRRRHTGTGIEADAGDEQ